MLNAERGRYTVWAFDQLKELTQYFFNVPSKFLSSPHLICKADRTVT